MQSESECYQLASYQRALLAILSSGASTEEIQERLRSEPEFRPFQKYVESFEPRMIEVAVELIGKWGCRDAEEGVLPPMG